MGTLDHLEPGRRHVGSGQLPAPRRSPYVETFEDGPGGWLGWLGPGVNVEPTIDHGAILSRSPWGVDANHAPPGAGYLTLLAYLHTRADRLKELGRPNRFIDGGYSRDLTNARLTVRLRGQVDLKGAQLLLLAQADIPGTRGNFVLARQPLRITPEWSEQMIVLAPDPSQWVCLGARHDLGHVYGCGDVGACLRDVNVDIIFVLFPLTVVSTTPVEDLHRLRPHRDYEPDQRSLPQGEVWIDFVRIDYATDDLAG